MRIINQEENELIKSKRKTFGCCESSTPPAEFCEPVTLIKSQVGAAQTLVISGDNNLVVTATSLGNSGVQDAVFASVTFNAQTSIVKIGIYLRDFVESMGSNSQSIGLAFFDLSLGDPRVCGIAISPQLGEVGSYFDGGSGITIVNRGAPFPDDYFGCIWLNTETGVAGYDDGTDAEPIGVNASYDNTNNITMGSTINAGDIITDFVQAEINYGSSAFPIEVEGVFHCDAE